MTKSELSQGRSLSGLLGLCKDFSFDGLGGKSSSRERRADVPYNRIALAVGFRIDRKEAREGAGTLVKELSEAPRQEGMVAWKSNEGSEKEY